MCETVSLLVFEVSSLTGHCSRNTFLASDTSHKKAADFFGEERIEDALP